MTEEKKVFVAGATGYLGRYLVAEYKKRGWTVLALARKQQTELNADRVIVAQATDPESLKGTMEGVDLVVSSLGITRQRDGLSYRDVDYQANLNLLKEAIAAKIPHFAYIHVLHADKLLSSEMVRAKQDFVNELRRNERSISSTIISPSGFFSDMKDFLDMAKEGRVYLFGKGDYRINPIDGSDLAEAAVDAIQSRKPNVDIGGPEIYTHRQMAEIAFEALGKEPKITFVWDGIRTFVLACLWMAPRHICAPAKMFLTAMGMDMTAECHGSKTLAEHYRQVLLTEKEKNTLP